MSVNIPLSYSPIDAAALGKVLQRYEGQPHSRVISDFEREISGITGSAHVVALNSGTAAIHLGLKALGVGPGDEVLVPSFTYVATINPILYLGANPVFIDSEGETWNMDPGLLEHAIKDRLAAGRKPRAVVVVHGYGMPGKMTAIMEVSRKYGIPVLEDAAEAIGSTYYAEHVGTFGDIGVLSFNNNKIITTYGGGALLTNKAEVAEKVLFWATQARDHFPYYHHSEVGFNYRIGPLNAAAGLSQLEGLHERIRWRREAFDYYSRGILAQKGWQFQEEPSGLFSNRWLTTAIVPANADVLWILHEMAARGVELRLLWKPMHEQPAFDHFTFYGTGLCTDLFARGICLPSGGVSIAERVTETLNVIS